MSLILGSVLLMNSLSSLVATIGGYLKRSALEGVTIRSSNSRASAQRSGGTDSPVLLNALPIRDILCRLSCQTPIDLHRSIMAGRWSTLWLMMLWLMTVCVTSIRQPNAVSFEILSVVRLNVFLPLMASCMEALQLSRLTAIKNEEIGNMAS